jgi:hypothetical protein
MNTNPTPPSSTSACHPPTPTKASAPRTTSVAGTQTSGFSCSTYTDTGWAEQPPGDGGGVGYLLKDRVNDVSGLLDKLHRVADGEPLWTTK